MNPTLLGFFRPYSLPLPPGTVVSFEVSSYLAGLRVPRGQGPERVEVRLGERGS